MLPTNKPSKVQHVRSWFEVPDRYLNVRRYDIQIRRETVQEFVHSVAPETVLDIGCGDGSISIPLLHSIKRLTLLDISTNMLSMARNSIPDAYSDRVSLVNSALIDAQLPENSFDLVLCLGVMAHVDSPAALIAEIARLVRPQGSIVLEFTDSRHFWGLPVVAYHRALKLLRPAPYELNRLDRNTVDGLLRPHGLQKIGVYRYGLPPIGAGMFLGQQQRYDLTRYIFGPANRNRNGWLGNEYIYHLRKS